MSRDPIDDPALAPLLRALTAPADERELDGLGGAVRSFRAARVTSPPHSTRRASMIFTLAGAKLGATLAALAVGAGGVATVAYVSASTPAATPEAHSTSAGSPTSVDATTHARRSTGAPSGTATAVGPDATGPAAHGLCTAWANVADKGKAAQAPAFRNLAAAAGGVDKVAAWCAALPAAGASDGATGQPSDHPTGKPSEHPTGKPTTVPNGRPATVPAQKPTTTPTGKPTVLPPTTHPTGRP